MIKISEKKAGGMASLFFGEIDYAAFFPFPGGPGTLSGGLPEGLEDLEEFFKDRILPERIDGESHIPDSVLRALSEKGLWGMKVPKEFGGLGLTPMEFNRITTLLSSHCVSTAISLSGSQCIGAAQFIQDYGSPEQQARILPRVAEGAITAFALTETEAGSDPSRLKTFVTQEEDGSFRLTGQKIWSTNGLIADYIIVIARDTASPAGKPVFSSFLVEKGSTGITYPNRCQFMGLHGASIGVIRFEDVKIAPENLIGRRGEGIRQALEILNNGRVTLNTACLGICKSSLRHVREYAKTRVQWGTPIGGIPAVAAQIGEIATLTFAVEAVTWYATACLQEGLPDLRLVSANAKRFCSEAGWKVADATLQVFGGKGYEGEESLANRGEAPNPVERNFRDARITRIIEGTNEIMLMFLARDGMGPALKVMASDPFLAPDNALIAPVRSDSLPADIDACIKYVRLTAGKLVNELAWLSRADHENQKSEFDLAALRLTKVACNLHVLLMASSYTSAILETGKGNGPQVRLLGALNAMLQIDNSNLLSANAETMMKDLHGIGESVLSGMYTSLEAGSVR